jgi:glutathione S-transferase
MMKLYYGQGTCALASHIALEEAGADYEAVRIDVLGGEQTRPEYLAINPKGRVPALVTDHGVLTENVAILAYIPETHPAAGLLPTDPWARAQAHAFNAYLAATVHVAHAHGRRGYRWADEESSIADMRRKVPANMAAYFQLIEDDYLKGPWVLGEAYSVCDGYLFTIADWLERDEVDPRRFPRVLDHRERVRARPAVAKVLAEEAA